MERHKNEVGPHLLETRLASRWVTETGDEKRHTDSAQYRGRVTSKKCGADCWRRLWLASKVECW